MSAENEQLARRYFDEVCNQRRLDVADEIIAADHVSHDNQSPPAAPGPDGIKETVAIYQGTLDGHWEVHEVLSVGDRVVTRWTGSGTHNAELLGVPPTGNDVSVEAISIMRIADGRIAETWTTWEALALAQQIGAVPAPASA
jgi:predicted ester cyclase